MASSKKTGRSDQHLGFDDLRAENLEAIRAGEFESFCYALLEVERFDRHTQAEVSGPQRQYVADGGKDLVFKVLGLPKQSKQEYEVEHGLALTNDAGTVCFSCKSGDKWREKVLKEADAPAGGKKRAPVDYLLEGGSFTILVNDRVGKDDVYETRTKPAKTKSGKRPPSTSTTRKTLLENVAARLWAQMRKVERSAPDPTPRLRIIDANDLAAYLRRRRPIELGDELLRKLGVALVPGLNPIDYWRHDHEIEREWPEFVEDDARVQMKREVRRALTAETDDPYARILWVHGPPGVGKTRLLLELLSETDDVAQSLKQRTRVALSFQPGLEAIENYSIAERFPRSVIIVDDCPAEEVQSLVKRFAYIARNSRAALVIVTPGLPTDDDLQRQQKSGVRVLKLTPLAHAAHEQLIRRALGQLTAQQGPAAEVVQQVERFSEGYPWYAVLIARGWKENPQAPLASAADAAKMALASRTETNNLESERYNLALDRARCLVIAMLTEHLDWDSISPTDRAGLLQAVGLDTWRRLEDLAFGCVRRGILRMRLKHRYKYVTPLVLGREVLLMLSFPPDDEPRSPLDRAIREHAAKFIPMFYELLNRLDIGSERGGQALAAIANRVLSEVQSGDDIAVLTRGTLQGPPLRFAVRCEPRRTAAVLRQLIEATPVETLRELESVRRDLVWALESLSRRRTGFGDAEAALFRLACAENEAYGNNATAVWGSLFSVELNSTYCPLGERLQLLRFRCTQGDSAVRLVGLSGIPHAISAHIVGYGGDPQDGPHESLTRQQARAARVDAWELLLELTSDVLPEVAERAQKLAIENLRDAARTDLGGDVAQMMIKRVASFDAKAMLALREKIVHVDAYDHEWIETDPEAQASWMRLKVVTAPQSYSERLRQRVGTWSRGGDEEEDDAGIGALAAEAAHEPEVLMAEMDWLDSSVAVRAPLFFVALGKSDARGAFLESLLERARGGKAHDGLSGYLRGWQQSGRASEVDKVLRAMRAEPALAVHMALSIWRMGATEERMTWLTEDIAAGRLTDGAIGALVLGSWELDASDEALRRMVKALLITGTLTAASVGLTLAVRRLNARDSIEESWSVLIERLLDFLADNPQGGLADYDWGRGGKLLVRTGRLEVALSLALRVIGHDDMRTSLDHGWEVLRACIAQDPRVGWRGFTSLLERRDAHLLTTTLRFRELGEAFPADEVLAWVGRNEQRAALIANLCAPHADDLSPLARGLLIRFGPESRAAGVLESRARFTPRATSSLAEFSQKQLRRARSWAKDPHPNVRTWAERVAINSKNDFDVHDAEEEYERRRWGT